jgi:hypothetical protein
VSVLGILSAVTSFCELGEVEYHCVSMKVCHKSSDECIEVREVVKLIDGSSDIIFPVLHICPAFVLNFVSSNN